MDNPEFFEPCMWKIAESLLLYAVKNSEVNNVLGQKYIFFITYLTAWRGCTTWGGY